MGTVNSAFKKWPVTHIGFKLFIRSIARMIISALMCALLCLEMTKKRNRLHLSKTH